MIFKLNAFLLRLGCLVCGLSAAGAASGPHGRDLVVEVVTGGYEAIDALRENRPIRGPRTDAVRAFLDTKGVSYKVSPMIWSRAYHRVQQEPYTLIYPLTRTPEREAHFDWIKQIDTHNYQLLGHIRLADRGLTKEEIISGQFFAVCEATTSNCEMLQEFGFPEDRIIRAKGKEVEGVAALVAAGRASFMMENLDAVHRQGNDLVNRTVVKFGGYSVVRREYLAGYKTAPALLELMAADGGAAASGP